MRLYIPSLVLFFINISCNSIINRAYNDTAAKYNGYFLAIESINKIENDLYKINNNNYDSLINLSYEIDTNQVSGLSDKKEDIIKKLSILIQRHEDSKYIYPSYALIGKARLLALEINQAITTLKYVNSKSNNEYAKQMSLIYLMRAYTEKEDYNSAIEVYNFLQNKTIDKELILEYHLFAHALFKKINDIEKLFRELISIESIAKKKSLINKVYFAIGQVYLINQEYELAQDYFKKCIKNNPSFEMEFNAKIFYSKALINNEKYEVDKFFNKLIRDKKNIDNLDRIYFEIGLSNYKKEKYNDAIRSFNISTKKNQNKNELLFYTYKNIADIYYDKIYNYRSAKLYYDSALTYISREYKDYDILKYKSDILNDLVKNLDIIQLNDSLIYLTTIPDFELDEILKKKIKLNKKNEKRKLGSVSQQNFSLNESKIILNNNEGEWYFSNSSIISIGINDFKRIWGNRELKDNWRLISKSSFNNEVNDLIAQKEDSKIKENEEINDDVQTVDKIKSSLPFEKSQKETLLKEIEEAYYSVGKIYIQKLNEIEKGIEVFKNFINRFNLSKYLPEIYYQLYLIEKDNAKYKDIILSNFKETEYYKLIINPNYKFDEFKELNFLKKTYNTLYENLIQGNSNIVISKVDSLEKYYNKNPFFENLSLLKAIGRGNQAGNFSLQFELKSFLEKSKNESSIKYASTLLKSAKEVHNRFIYSGLPKFNNNIDSKYYFFTTSNINKEKVISILNECLNKANIAVNIYSFLLDDNIYFEAFTYKDYKILKQIEKDFKSKLNNEEINGNTNFVIGEKNMNLIFKSKNYEEFSKFYM